MAVTAMCAGAGIHTMDNEKRTNQRMVRSTAKVLMHHHFFPLLSLEGPGLQGCLKGFQASSTSGSAGMLSGITWTCPRTCLTENPRLCTYKK